MLFIVCTNSPESTLNSLIGMCRVSAMIFLSDYVCFIIDYHHLIQHRYTYIAL